MFFGCVWIRAVEYSKEAFSKTEAQFGSSGPAHGEAGEMEKSRRELEARSSCFSSEDLSLWPSISTREAREDVCLNVSEGEVFFSLASGAQPEP